MCACLIGREATLKLILKLFSHSLFFVVSSSLLTLEIYLFQGNSLTACMPSSSPLNHLPLLPMFLCFRVCCSLSRF